MSKMRFFGLFGRPNIARLKEKGQTDEIIQALHSSEDHNVRFEAASALGDIGNENCVEPLIAALEDHPRIKEVAIRSLGKIGDTRATPLLLHALADDSWEIRSTAAKALGAIGDARAAPKLIEALENEGEAVRWYMVTALTNITGENFGNDIEQWKEWYNNTT